MSKLAYKKFICKKCSSLIDPRDFIKSQQCAFKIKKDGRLQKKISVVATCKNGHIGVYPRYLNIESYIRHMEDGIAFHMSNEIWIQKYMEDSNAFIASVGNHRSSR